MISTTIASLIFAGGVLLATFSGSDLDQLATGLFFAGIGGIWLAIKQVVKIINAHRTKA